tara:strand:+ start:523 stop:1191 length:669 start_codon:yes stop_codon:yes gene_type:complete
MIENKMENNNWMDEKVARDKAKYEKEKKELIDFINSLNDKQIKDRIVEINKELTEITAQYKNNLHTISRNNCLGRANLRRSFEEDKSELVRERTLLKERQKKSKEVPNKEDENSQDDIAYNKTTKRKLWDSNKKLNKLIYDMEEVKKTSPDGDYEDCCLIDLNEWKSYWTQEDRHQEAIERMAEEVEDYKKINQENKKLKQQMDQQHKELQEIKAKLMELAK